MILFILKSFADSDCVMVKSLAQAWNMNTQSGFGTQLQELTNCCAAKYYDNVKQTTSRVQCDASQRVTGIEWNGLNLFGTIDTSKFPPLLTSIDLYYNNFNGPIPTNWPNRIKTINLNKNQFSGNVPINWPGGLINLQLGENQLTSELSKDWPISLVVLELYNNKLTGPIPVGFPNGLQILNLGSNRMNGTIPVLPSSLTLLRIDRNSFSGDILNFPRGVTNLAANNNKLSGKLVLTKPIIVDISNNSISDIQISDTSALADCDISLNPLLNHPQVSRLTMCAINGLYSITPARSSVFSSRKLSATQEYTTLRSSTNIGLISKLNTIQYSTVVTIVKTNTAILLNSLMTIEYSTIDTYSQKTSATEIVSIPLPTATLTSDFRSSDVSPFLIYGLFLGFTALCVLVFISSKVFKHPKMASKFGRKNSFGTLNSQNTSK